MSWALGACTQRAAPVVAIDVEDGSGDPRGSAVADVLPPLLAEAVDQLPGFEQRPARDGERAYQLRATIGLVTERPTAALDERRRAVGITLSMWSLDREVDVQVHGLASGEGPEAVGFEPTAREAVAIALSRLQVALRLRGADPEDVIAALRSDDDAVRDVAIATAGERELTEAVPTMGELLRSDTLPTSVALDIVGALVAIGDPAATEPIIETVESRPLEFWPQIIFALSELGGRKAEGFLFTVAKGHDDPRIRAVAEQALLELERRRKGDAEP